MQKGCLHTGERNNPVAKVENVELTAESGWEPVYFGSHRVCAGNQEIKSKVQT